MYFDLHMSAVLPYWIIEACFEFKAKILTPIKMFSFKVIWHKRTKDTVGPHQYYLLHKSDGFIQGEWRASTRCR